MTTPQSLSDTEGALALCLREMDHNAMGSFDCAAEILITIAAGKIPGVILSAPPCTRMCEAKAVEITMGSLRTDLAAANAKSEEMAGLLREATSHVSHSDECGENLAASSASRCTCGAEHLKSRISAALSGKVAG